MSVRFSLFASLLLCCAVHLSAMVIHNDLNRDSGSTRSESGNFNEDYLFLGRNLQFSGQTQDLVFLGRKLTFSGKTTLGTFALCQDISFTGQSGNGIMVACMDIDISGKISGDNYVACRELQVGKNASIQGNLFSACADLEINGTLEGNLFTAAHELIINSEIRGNVTAYARRIHIGENGRITGTLMYTSQRELSSDELARVKGTVKHEKAPTWQNRTPSRRVAGILVSLAMHLSFIITGLLLLFLPAFRGLDTPLSQRSFWHTVLWGLVPLLMYPAFVILSFIMVVTIPFGIMLVLAFVPLLYLAGIIGTVMIGKFLVATFAWRVQKRHYQFLIGGLGLAILSLIPFVNMLAFIFVSALGWGMYVSFILKREL